MDSSYEELLKKLEAAEQRAHEAEQRADEAERQLEKTTLTGYATDPKGKTCPTRLERWENLPKLQQGLLDDLFSHFPPDEKVFPTLAFLSGLGDSFEGEAIADHGGIDFFLKACVENPVRDIIVQVDRHYQTRATLGIPSLVTFDNYVRNATGHHTQATSQQSTQPTTPGPNPNRLKVRPDRVCIREIDQRSVYHIEYKPPHKLKPSALRCGLDSMNVLEEVVNRAEIPTEANKEEQTKYHARRLAMAAVAQTFHYMIWGGVEYGLLRTGEAFVFLKVDWDDPSTVYFHLTELDRVAQKELDLANVTYWSAVSQVLAFTLIALSEEPPGQDQLLGRKALETWRETFDDIYGSTPPKYRDPDWYPKRPPTLLKRSPRPKRVKGDARPGGPSGRDSPPPGPSGGGAQLPDSPSPNHSTRPGRAARQPRERGSETSSSRHGRRGGTGAGKKCPAYCTHNCLLGLARGGELDKTCPNFELHREPEASGPRGDDAHHPVSHAKWLLLLAEQLGKTLDEGVVRSGMQGARGVLFQVTLLAYGYTFVAKGTIAALADRLEHEATVYRRLAPLQGVCVPVFLGDIDLRSIGRTYYYDFDVDIVRLIFLSWAGESLHKLPLAPEADLGKEITWSVRALHCLGVAHTDVRIANALWSREKHRVMMIDFESAILRSPPQHLLQTSPNKRRRVPGRKDRPNIETEFDRQARNDMWAAEYMLQSCELQPST